MPKVAYALTLAILTLAILTLATYRHGLDSQFIGDDNSRITAMAEFLGQGYGESVTAILPDRPILVITILLNYSLGGLDPWGYKALSLLLHVAVGLVFFALLLAVQKRFFASGHPLAPALAAALFLVHPLNSQALLSSIQRGVILASLGALASFLAFLAYLSTGKRAFSLLSLLFFVVGILSKSFVVTLPLIFLLYLFLCERKVRPHLRSLAPFFAAALLPLIPYALGVNLQAGNGLRWYEYLSIQTRVVWIYLKLFVAPANLRFFYEIDANPDLLANYTWLAIVGHLALLGAGVYGIRRKPLVSFGIFAMYLALLPESGFFAIDHLAFEHRAYFPLLFFLWTLFALVRSRPSLSPRLAVVPLAAIVALAVATDHRIREVDTHEKWAFNTYGYQTPSRWNNIWLLDDLYGVGSTARGLETCETMIAEDPAFTPYRLYRRLFLFPEAPRAERAETVELISRALLAPEQWLRDNDVVANRLLSFIVNNSREFADSPLTYQKNLERVFRNQVPAFLRSPGSFADVARLHRKLLGDLRGHFETKLRGGGLDDADLVQYLNVLGQVGLCEPGERPRLDALFERLASEDPRRAELVESARSYYRDLRSELER